MAGLLERFVKQLTIDRIENRHPLPDRQRPEVALNGFCELDGVGHSPPDLTSVTAL